MNDMNDSNGTNDKSVANNTGTKELTRTRKPRTFMTKFTALARILETCEPAERRRLLNMLDNSYRQASDGDSE